MKRYQALSSMNICQLSCFPHSVNIQKGLSMMKLPIISFIFSFLSSLSRKKKWGSVFCFKNVAYHFSYPIPFLNSLSFQGFVLLFSSFQCSFRFGPSGLQSPSVKRIDGNQALQYNYSININLRIYMDWTSEISQK